MVVQKLLGLGGKDSVLQPITAREVQEAVVIYETVDRKRT